jgi:NAD(P)-dependent dehydrogenase (short-subunit alcohol dehydrogenase family)
MLDGKVCIVTGAAGSIGFATTRLLVDEGAKVMLVDVAEDRVRSALAALRTDRAAATAANVADVDQTRRYVTDTVAKWGRIDVLFSNAGNDGPNVPVVDYPEDAFDSMMAVHVRGSFLACKYAIPHMNDGGSIVITSSITGVHGVANNAAYATAKHALVGLMRSLAKELAPRRIRVNTINPGPLDNEFMRRAERRMEALTGRDAGAMFDQIIPMGRHGRPEEVARTVVFLASDHSSYTTGATHLIDGALGA